ncbi:uncharacterized protein LOC127750118 isoform X2 [Frankliniella occidentalis]|uniref:Uncharacterized protein LOC127750118 isoform X2 n=1 Tax=Frankliniella occidentalis TaxID=133901 RepID=A0A9C6UB16_FRAOC|nr:uncharacterized protein LOC127750118 isoform X2 [Frankliniella occidentalis]
MPLFTGKVPVIVNSPRASEVRSAPTRSILGLHTNNQNFDRFGLRDISNTNSAEQRSTAQIVTPPQVDSNTENPVVSVIKSMFTSSQTQPEKPSRQVT